MGDLSKNFNRHEFECQGKDCCEHSAPVHPELIDGLQILRDMVGHRIDISSGFRCKRHNRKENGSKNSFHTLGMAADIACFDKKTGEQIISPEKLAQLAELVTAFNTGGIGLYKWGIHVDVREHMTRWRG